MMPTDTTIVYLISSLKTVRNHLRGQKMQLKQLLIIATLLAITTGCRRQPDTFWDDTKSAGRHVQQGVRTLGGKHGDSRLVQSRNDINPQRYREEESEYVPLYDDPNYSDISAMEISRPPKESPGEAGSSIPGISAFTHPSQNPRHASVFRNIYFAYNSPLVKGEDGLTTVRNVASYLKQHPNTYIFVEGHCDERGPEAYNFALGANRSNTVRNLIIQEGVSPDNVFTISYGKDRPAVCGHDESVWSQNRRVEFRVYER